MQMANWEFPLPSSLFVPTVIYVLACVIMLNAIPPIAEAEGANPDGEILFASRETPHGFVYNEADRLVALVSFNPLH
jgi:hypothetical protein